MKKVFAVLMVIVLLLGCGACQTTTSSQQEPTCETQKLSAETGEKALPASSSTLQPMLFDEKSVALLAIWPLNNHPIEEHGELIEFHIMNIWPSDSQVSAIFSSKESIDDLKKKYQSMIEGDWVEKVGAESARTLECEGFVDGVRVQCMLDECNGQKHIHIILFVDDDFSRMTQMIDEYWPEEIIETNDAFNEQTPTLSGIAVVPRDEAIIIYRDWDCTDGQDQELFDKYQFYLSGFDDYEYRESDQITGMDCTIDGTGVSVMRYCDMHKISISVVLPVKKT